MRRNFKSLPSSFMLIAAILLAGVTPGGKAHAATASSSASATVVGDPVSLSDSTPGLSVSTFVSDSTGDLLIRIPGSGLCATPGGSEDIAAPSFTAIGDEAARQTMTMSDFVSLSAGDGTLTSTAGRPSGDSTAVVCGGDGKPIKPSATFSTVLVGPARVSGSYAGTFTVTVVFN
jgi:hypothetical protein